MIDNMEGQLSFADLGLLSTKMSQEPSPATKERTSRQSSRKSSGSQNQKLPMFLCLRRDGAKPGASMEWTDGGALRGEYTTRSFGESPSVVNESHLSQILEVSAHQRFYLSARACQGILTRAERRGKELPEALKKALENQMSGGSNS